MRVGLNLLPCLPEIRGGWNYVSGILRAVVERDPRVEYVAFVTDASRALLPEVRNITVVNVGVNVRSRLRRVVWEHTWLQILAWRHKVDVMHWFANTVALTNTVPSVVTIYDLQAFRDFVALPRTKRVYTRLMMRHAARRADILLPMSQATRTEAIDRLNVRSVPTVVVPPALDERFRLHEPSAIDEFRRRHGLPARFWVYVANFIGYKNHLRLIEAYRAVRDERAVGWPLVLRGDPSDPLAADLVRAKVQSLGLADDVWFLPALAPADVPLLYAAATALVFPSLYEGGGMPVVEAMACGCPVLASNIAPVLEFAGTAGTYFDPSDTDSIAQAMLTFMDGPEHAERRRLGLERAREFSPAVVGQGLLNVYRRFDRAQP